MSFVTRFEMAIAAGIQAVQADSIKNGYALWRMGEELVWFGWGKEHPGARR